MRAGRVIADFRAALALGLAAAVSLGLARFAYALLLPAMRADLGWTYFTAGAMNTANAAGYLLGALLAPRLLARWGERPMMLAGGAAAALLLLAHGSVRSDAALLALRLATGAASAASFVGGGVLAAHLAATHRAGQRAGLVLGLYYGGTGAGIVAPALLLPWLMQHFSASPGGGWPQAWVALGLMAAVSTGASALGTRGLAAGVPGVPGAPAAAQAFAWRRFGHGLAAYGLFGLGYIGYMTFIITLLREQGLSASVVTAFYAVLGLGVMLSPWLWAGLLQRHRGGRPLALLNALLALATALPVVSAHPAAVFASGALFGGVFLSLVASTTALVRHNAPPAAWPAGIAAFTVVFALGQILGPSLVGVVADGRGLAAGLAVSAACLVLGAGLATRQKALPPEVG